MLDKLIRETEEFGGVYIGYISDLQDIDIILNRMNSESIKKEVVCFCRDNEFEAISKILSLMQVPTEGIFIRVEPRKATELIMDLAFKRGVSTVYVLRKPHIKKTIFIPQEDIKATNCIIIEN